MTRKIARSASFGPSPSDLKLFRREKCKPSRKATKTWPQLSANTSDFRLTKQIGAGSGGRVYLAAAKPGTSLDKHQQANSNKVSKLAMKAVWKNSNNEKEVKHLRKEHAILNSLSGHPNIIRVYSNLLEDKHKACFIMEYAEGGDLFDYTLRQHHLTEVEAWRIFHQLIKAVAFIHANHICHRDIKPENIFLDRERQVKLGDFGLATTWSPFKRMTKTVGSLQYAAPEVLRPGQSYTGPEVDMWSCGVVLYMMLTGKMPFHAYSDMDVYQNITAGHYDSSILPSEASRDLVESLLEPDPLVRSTIYEVINHEWMMSPPGLHRAMSLPEIHNGQSVELRATQKTHPSTPSSASASSSSKTNKREQESPRKRERMMASRLNVIMEEEQ